MVECKACQGWSVRYVRRWSVRSARGEVYDLPGGGV